MTERRPSVPNAVVLDGTNESDPVRIARGTVRICVSPRTTTTVRVSLIQNGTQVVGSYFELVNGQPFTFDANAGDTFGEFDLFLFAAAAMTVDVVWW